MRSMLIFSFYFLNNSRTKYVHEVHFIFEQHICVNQGAAAIQKFKILSIYGAYVRI